MSSAVLAAAYALHMTATAVWIGGLIFLGFLSSAFFDRLDPADRPAARTSLSRRFLPLAWLCLAVFVVTGLTQMSANPSYAGLLVVTNAWSAAILVKHLIVGLMAIALAVQTWVVHPRLERAALGLDHGGATSPDDLRRLDGRLIRWSAVLGLAVLLLTAVARASN
jgi:putative copper export protein